MGSNAKLLQQRGLRRVPLLQHGEIQHAQQAIVDVVHLRVAGEEYESTTSRDLEQTLDAVRCLRDELMRARVGEIGRYVQNYLALIIEMRRHDGFTRMIEAEALADVIES